MRALLVSLTPELQRSLGLALPAHGCGVEVARTSTEAFAFLATSRHYQLIVVGEAAPMIGRMRIAAPTASLVWAREGLSLAEAVDATKSGAIDVWDGAPSSQRLEAALAPGPVPVSMRRDPIAEPNVVAHSLAMQDLLRVLARVARSDVPILLTGETGTGKGKLSRFVHEASDRRKAPFVVVDCAGLAPGLAENELFGHSRGAFTGADREAVGRFEAADGGTLFLDEVGELPLPTQQKLLRFLEEGEVERLGEVRARRVDARIVAATHRDLRGLVRVGAFREDLLYRLEVMDAHLPALRERADDILDLARDFAAATGVVGALFDDAAEALLLGYAWPGNVRELRNVVERALVLRTDPAARVGVDLLPPRLRAAASRPAPPRPESSGPVDSADLPGAEVFDLETAERSRITDALRRYPKLEEAAAALGIDPSTLWRKRKRLGLG